MLLLTDPIKQLKVPLSSADGEQISVCVFLQISQTAMGFGVTQGRWLNPISTCGKTASPLRFCFIETNRRNHPYCKTSDLNQFSRSERDGIKRAPFVSRLFVVRFGGDKNRKLRRGRSKRRRRWMMKRRLLQKNAALPGPLDS